VEQLRDFYRRALWALEDHMRAGGTATGFGPVLKRVARECGVDVDGVPLPRLNRAELEDQGRGRRRR
jgi:hypothetical protein